MMWPMLRSTRDHFFQKRFPKLNFLKTVSVTIITNREKMKVKKSHPLYNFCISSFLALLLLQIDFLKNCSTTQFFGNFIPSSEKGLGGGRKLCIFIPKSDLRNNIWLFLCVFVGAFWCFLNVFIAAGHVWYGFL